jgi:hypothetical protein
VAGRQAWVFDNGFKKGDLGSEAAKEAGGPSEMLTSTLRDMCYHHIVFDLRFLALRSFASIGEGPASPR